jgi:nucleotide-binding universal stress UspA family protein
MRSRANHNAAAKGAKAGTFLYVTDLVSDSDEVLEFACELAERNGSHLELIHVLDLVHAPSAHDRQVGIQHRLDMLARRLRRLQLNVASTLLFGSSEDVISKRAEEIKARLIVLVLNQSSSAEVQQRFARRLARKVGCPVVILPEKVA